MASRPLDDWPWTGPCGGASGSCCPRYCRFGNSAAGRSSRAATVTASCTALRAFFRGKHCRRQWAANSHSAPAKALRVLPGTAKQRGAHAIRNLSRHVNGGGYPMVSNGDRNQCRAYSLTRSFRTSTPIFAQDRGRPPPERPGYCFDARPPKWRSTAPSDRGSTPGLRQARRSPVPRRPKRSRQYTRRGSSRQDSS